MRLRLGRFNNLGKRWTYFGSFDGLEDAVGRCMGPYPIYDWVESMLMGLAYTDFIFEMRRFFGERIWPIEAISI